MISRLRSLLSQLMDINNYADIPGIDDKLAHTLQENIQNVYDLTAYYQAVLKDKKLPTGPKATLAANQLLLYLYLYIHSYAGVKPCDAYEGIESLLRLLDVRFDNITVEQRIIKTAKRVLASA